MVTVAHGGTPGAAALRHSSSCLLTVFAMPVSPHSTPPPTLPAPALPSMVPLSPNATEALSEIVSPLSALTGPGKGLPAFRKGVREMMAHEICLRNKQAGRLTAGAGGWIGRAVGGLGGWVLGGCS